MMRALLVALGLLTVASAQNMIFNQGSCPQDCLCNMGCCSQEVIETTTPGLLPTIIGLPDAEGPVLQTEPAGYDARCDRSQNLTVISMIPMPYPGYMVKCWAHSSSECSDSVVDSLGQPAYDHFKGFKFGIFAGKAGVDCSGNFACVSQIDIPRSRVESEYWEITFDAAQMARLEFQTGQYFGFFMEGGGWITYTKPDTSHIGTYYDWCIGDGTNGGTEWDNTFMIDGASGAKRMIRSYQINCLAEPKEWYM